jgi:hypothetical protein
VNIGEKEEVEEMAEVVKEAAVAEGSRVWSGMSCGTAVTRVRKSDASIKTNEVLMRFGSLKWGCRVLSLLRNGGE